MNTQVQFENINYNQESEDFVATFSCIGKTFQLSLLDFNEGDGDAASTLAHDICNWLQSGYEAAKEFCAAKLLDLKNEVWLEEQEEPLSKEKFIETIELEGISAFSDGNFTLYFADNDIFWGHTIVVDVDQDYIMTGADLAG